MPTQEMRRLPVGVIGGTIRVRQSPKLSLVGTNRGPCEERSFNYRRQTRSFAEQGPSGGGVARGHQPLGKFFRNDSVEYADTAIGQLGPEDGKTQTLAQGLAPTQLALLQLHGRIRPTGFTQSVLPLVL